MLHHVIINLDVVIPHFKHDLLINIMQEVWESNPPKNAMSLIKSFLKKHYEARKNNEDLPVPEKCKGYQILKVLS